MEDLKLNEVFLDDQASEYYNELIESEHYEINNNELEADFDSMLYVNRYSYELCFQYDNNVACYIKRIS